MLKGAFGGIAGGRYVKTSTDRYEYFNNVLDREYVIVSTDRYELLITDGSFL